MNRFVIAVLMIIMSSNAVSAQTPYTSMKDDRQVTILNGIITKYILQNDPSFGWYATSQAGYTPDAAILQTMAAAKDKVQFIIFGGTWCEDTQSVLPKFFKLQEQSGIADSNTSFFGVDRQKKTLSNITAAFNITNVPTIIIMKDGKETGRIVEYGKTGKWDQELAEMLK